MLCIFMLLLLSNDPIRKSYHVSKLKQVRSFLLHSTFHDTMEQDLMGGRWNVSRETSGRAFPWMRSAHGCDPEIFISRKEICKICRIYSVIHFKKGRINLCNTNAKSQFWRQNAFPIFRRSIWPIPNPALARSSNRAIPSCSNAHLSRMISTI